MSMRMLKLLIFSALLATIVSYLFYLNPESATVHYARSATWNAPMALVLIITFFFGAAVTAIVAMLYGIQLNFWGRKMKKQSEMLRAHQKQATNAREQLALQNFEAARAAFSKIVDRDADDTGSRIDLANVYYRQGALLPALQVLEKARREQKKNAELLLLAAEINSELGNSTAALDNALLVLTAHPRSTAVLRLVVERAWELGRVEEAIGYQTQLLRLVSGEEHSSEQEKLASLEVDKARKLHGGDPAAFRSALEDVLRRHKDFPEALNELAAMECDALSLEAATKHWSKLFQITGDLSHLRNIAQVWLHADNPSRAVALVRNAIPQKAPARETARARLFLVALLQHVEMIDQARDEYGQLDITQLRGDEERRLLAAVQACFSIKEGKLPAAVSTLLEVLDVSDVVTGKEEAASNGARNKGSVSDTWVARLLENKDPVTPPSPRLSTP